MRPNRFRLPAYAGTVAERIDRTLQRSGRYHQQFHVLGEMNKTIAVDISAARRDLRDALLSCNRSLSDLRH